MGAAPVQLAQRKITYSSFRDVCVYALVLCHQLDELQAARA
jgi:hypothetical protein